MCRGVGYNNLTKGISDCGITLFVLLTVNYVIYDYDDYNFFYYIVCSFQ